MRGQLIEVDMTPGETSYRLVEGRGLLVHHAGEELRLTPGEPVRRSETPVSPLQVTELAASAEPAFPPPLDM